MRRLVSVVSLSLFVLWILPLGVFIKPSQEKLACDGQRAICLCSHLLKKAAKKAMPGTFFKTTASAGQKENNAGSATHPFLAGNSSLSLSMLFLRVQHEESFQYNFFLLKPIEHIPKA